MEATGREPRPPKAADASDRRRWAAVLARDKDADGSFVYSVASTGVYCRPSCPSRQARRDNVSFHDGPRQAEAAGFRPCKRCRPDESSEGQRRARLVAAACRAIEVAEEPPSLAALAADAGLSPFHFHRMFKSITGLTPKAYAAGHRRSRIREALRGSRTVTEAIHASGFASAGRFYADAAGALGMSPSQYRAGGRDTDMEYAFGRCSLGLVLVAASAVGITAILLGDDQAALIGDLERRFPAARLARAGRKFLRLLADVIDLIEAPGAQHELPLDIRGTAFQIRVWQALRAIPPGVTASYADIARRIGAPRAARAVAGACAANSLAVAIPCHRVVRGNGSLSGYRWGVARKKALLDRESR